MCCTVNVLKNVLLQHYFSVEGEEDREIAEVRGKKGDEISMNGIDNL